METGDWGVIMNRSSEMQRFPFKEYEQSRAVIDEMGEALSLMDDARWCEHNDYIALYELALGLHDDSELPGYIMEYGTNQGASACAMAHAIKDSDNQFKPVFTVDPFHDRWGGKHKIHGLLDLCNNQDMFYEYVCPIISESSQIVKFWNLPVRILFIDASHGYSETQKEIAESLRFIVERGWLVLHDYGGEYGEGVVKAVNEFLDSHTDTECYFVEPRLICIRILRRY